VGKFYFFTLFGSNERRVQFEEKQLQKPSSCS
jgi:hypothetical protein